MKRILLSTKLKTTNIGNQALSDELIELASEFESDEVKFKLTGRPFGLDKYTYDYFGTNNPLDKFEETAQSIAKKGLKLKAIEFEPTNLKKVKTNLLEVEGFVVKTEKYRRVARKIRKFIYSFFLFSNTYKMRLQQYKNIDYYLYSGAGEVGPTEFFLRQLLDLRVAQIMGIKTCAINQSVEFAEGLNKDFLIHVYSKMHKIVVRGDMTKVKLIEYGVPSNFIFVCPDTAFRNKVKLEKDKKITKKIAINFNHKTYLNTQVDNVIQFLIKSGYDITFISNEPKGDSNVAFQINSKFAIPIELKSFTYAEYSMYLQKFSFIISSRLHSNELALTSGIPIIPVEGNVFKTKEVLTYVKYPLDVISYKENNYEEQLLKNINILENDYENILSWIHQNLEKICNESENNIKIAIS